MSKFKMFISSSKNCWRQMKFMYRFRTALAWFVFVLIFLRLYFPAIILETAGSNRQIVINCHSRESLLSIPTFILILLWQTMYLFLAMLYMTLNIVSSTPITILMFILFDWLIMHESNDPPECLQLELPFLKVQLF